MGKLTTIEILTNCSSFDRIHSIYPQLPLKFNTKFENDPSSHSYHRVIYRIRTTCRWNQERLKLKREETQPLEGPTNLSRRINPIRSTKFSTTRPCKRRVDRENNTVAKRGWMYLDEIASSPLPLSAFTRDSYSPCDDSPSFLPSFLPLRASWDKFGISLDESVVVPLVSKLYNVSLKKSKELMHQPSSSSSDGINFIQLETATRHVFFFREEGTIPFFFLSKNA